MKLAKLSAALLLTQLSCNDHAAAPLPGVGVVEERFVTEPMGASNLDSPAVWFGPQDQQWLIVTGKSTHRLYVYDAVTGEAVRTVGRPGSERGEFRRPNGVAVVDDLVLVVERDNRRAQVLRLPGFEHVMFFGEAQLIKPYGIALLRTSVSELDVFITDDYRGFLGRTPGDRALGQRVKHYRLRPDVPAAHFVHAFGETSGAGRLRQVESLAVDRTQGVILIADEEARDIKIYHADGRYSGRTFGRDVLRHEPEGIVLYECPDGDGYWLVADQHRRANRFLVFDRRSFALRGAFSGRTVTNTDGVALVQQPVGTMRNGVFYAVHDDRAVGAFDWTAIARSLGLRADCNSEGEPGL